MAVTPYWTCQIPTTLSAAVGGRDAFSQGRLVAVRRYKALQHCTISC